MTEIIKVRDSQIFSPQHQNDFAELSGDSNPLHMDLEYGRKSLFGHTIVHGAHLVLWSLNIFFKKNISNGIIDSLSSEFRNPVKVGEEATVFIDKSSPKNIKIEIKVKHKLCSIITFALSEKEKEVKLDLPSKNPTTDKAIHLKESELHPNRGELEMFLNTERFSKLFSNINIENYRLCVLMMTVSRLSGMHCPGLNSVFFRINLSKKDAVENCSSVFSYNTEKYDHRFRKLLLKANTDDFETTITSFVRPEPVVQPNYKTVSEYALTLKSPMRALIIGGSRGLGEVTAKILAASKAEVCITYHRSESEARLLKEEIFNDGGFCHSLKFDATNPVLDPFLNDWNPTHVFYFATPYIFDGSAGGFSTSLYEKFSNYYVTGFNHCLELFANQETSLKVFYPSSVAVDSKPPSMGEYVAAKLAGEYLCEFLQKSISNLSIHIERLPRIETDQTVSFYPVENKSPLEVMLEVLKRFLKG